MDAEYDVVVAGAGVAGALAAASAAKNGAKTLLIDRNTKAEPGKKTNWGWVCGDAVAKSHVDMAEKMLGIKFGSELGLPVEGVYAFSPDLETKIMFEGAGFSLNRPKFARKLLELALKFGAEYLPEHEIEGPILEGERVVGVFGRDHNKAQFKVNGKVVIDALGMASMIRRKLPVNDYIEKDISIDDIESTGRYIIKFEHKAEQDDRYYDPKNALIHLNQELAPGGYGWVFPKEDKTVNIGVGVEKHSLEIRNAKMNKKDTLHSLIDNYVNWNPILENKGIHEEDNNGKGYWSVTVRRQQHSLVFNGYLGAGDSMAMANPISAGGIGPGIVSGLLAGETAAECVREKKLDMKDLWKYNLKFNQAYGSKMAGLEVFRIYMQSMNNEMLNFGMKKFITKEEAVQISYGNVPELSMVSMLSKVISGAQNVTAFKNLVSAISEMKKLNQLYAKYPATMQEFKPWSKAVFDEMKQVKEKFKPNPI